ncbi:hypothetical protein PsorP6_002560 [Peronosclerospora sorghi]|uniref:Uncharacterized protein n=1 Tax=Peronosclerospora sorghi TaxID=230839 RepID=A0ACC0WX95_9STRA|nr:hypothetical protein PsorP6_002560 [Peronosclerospora sorghi]
MEIDIEANASSIGIASVTNSKPPMACMMEGSASRLSGLERPLQGIEISVTDGRTFSTASRSGFSPIYKYQ